MVSPQHYCFSVESGAAIYSKGGCPQASGKEVIIGPSCAWELLGQSQTYHYWVLIGGGKTTQAIPG